MVLWKKFIIYILFTMIYRANHTIDPSTLEISHQYNKVDSNKDTITESSELKSYIVNTKFRGTKLNMKQYKQKVQLKNIYQNKRIPRQKSKTYRGEIGLLESIGWNEEFSRIEQYEEDWKKLQLKPLTSQRQRKKIQSERRPPKTADQLMRRRSKEKRTEPNIQNFLTTIVPTKDNNRTVSFFYSENLEPRSNEIMNIAIRNAITTNKKSSPQQDQSQQKNLSKMYLPNHKMLKTRLKSRSLSTKKQAKKKGEEKEDGKILEIGIGKVSPLMYRLVEEKKTERKIYRNQQNGSFYLSLSK